MMKCLSRAIYVCFITIIYVIAMYTCASAISAATNENGLLITEVNSEASTITLDCGITQLKVELDTVEGLYTGDRVPIEEELQPYADRTVIIVIVIIMIVSMFYMLELFDVGNYIRMSMAKRGLKIVGEITSYDRIAPFLYLITVKIKESKYHSAYPIFKFEQKKYPIGMPATVYNGGVRRTWVTFTREKQSH